MKHKLNTFFKILTLGGLLAGASALGQTTVAAPGTGASYGLLGQNYYGVAYTYTHHVWRLPHVLHRYSFLANSAYAPGIDAGFAFDWESGSASGVKTRTSTVSVPLHFYKYTSWGRPFVRADAGWSWLKTNTTKFSGFKYLIGAGFEAQIKPNLVVTPSLTYWEAKRQHLHAWDGGVTATLRMTQDWSGSFGVRMDEHNNIAYTIGFNMHR